MKSEVLMKFLSNLQQIPYVLHCLYEERYHTLIKLLGLTDEVIEGIHPHQKIDYKLKFLSFYRIFVFI